MTDIEPVSVLTLGPVLARSPVAHVHPGLAVVASEAVPAPTGVVIDAIETDSTIECGVCWALSIKLTTRMMGINPIIFCCSRSHLLLD